MPFVNIKSIIPSTLCDIKKTGMLLPASSLDKLLFVANFEGQVVAVNLSSDDDKFRARVVDKESSQTGMFIEDIQFEVDYESVIDRYSAEAKTGDLQIHGGCAQIIVAMNNQGRLIKMPIPFLPIEGSGDGPETAFRIWRIVHMVGEERVALFEHGKPKGAVFA